VALILAAGRHLDLTELAGKQVDGGSAVRMEHRRGTADAALLLDRACRQCCSGCDHVRARLLA
jgi:hypothetical protein